ncbi:MAG: hypothetical protein VW830_12305, partial [Rhodobiaceae bacterium]
NIRVGVFVGGWDDYRAFFVWGRALLVFVFIAGAVERPEFIRQNALLPLAWQGLGTPAYSRLLAGDHHFSVIDHLADAGSSLCDAACAPSLAPES